MRKLISVALALCLTIGGFWGFVATLQGGRISVMMLLVPAFIGVMGVLWLWEETKR